MKELAVLPAKITDVLVITPDIEGDLYNEASQKVIESKIELLGSLAFNDDQEAEMDETATAMNKFATALDKLSAATYKKVTESASANRDITKAQVAVIKGHRTRIISQFETQRKAKLDAIGDILANALAEAWEEKGVSIDFRKVDLPEPKKTMLTPAGSLTSATKKMIDQLAQNDRNWELELNSRKMHVELECRRAGIDTPFSENYIGGVFYGQDKAVFEARLESLVKEELKRREDAKEKMRQELEVENQRKINEALRNQEAENKRQRDAEEADRKRQEIKSVAIVQPLKESVAPDVITGLDTENPMRAINPEITPELKPVEIKQPQILSSLLSGNLLVTATFLIEITYPRDKKSLIEDFGNALPKALLDKLQSVEISHDS